MERFSTVDLLVLTSLDQLLLILEKIPFYITSYIEEELKCTDPSLPVRIPRS
jgi:hypothetical protein